MSNPTSEDRRRGRWILRAGIVLLILAAAGIVVSTLMLASWSEVDTVDAADAAAAFARARAEAGDGTPYLSVDDDGVVRVQRDQERDERAELDALHLLAWEPESGRLVRVEFPYWFVRVKLSESLNLGTITTALAGDWSHLDLSVTEEDLERRGPALVLDEENVDGARILLWTR